MKRGNNMDRIKRLSQQLPENIDAALITSDVNRRYYTGFVSSAGTLLVTRKEAVLLLDSRYVEAGSKKVTDAKVMLMTDMAKQLNELFEEFGVKTVGIESGYMTVESLFSLRRTLNVTILDEPYLNEDPTVNRNPMNCAFGPITVPEGNYWVMGDNRNNSADSRFHMGDEFQGTVPGENIIGKVQAIILPFNRIGTVSSPDISVG